MKKFIFILVALSIIITMFYLFATKKYEDINSHFFKTNDIGCEAKLDAYKKNCIDLFNDLLYPNPKSFYRPPLNRIPNNIFDEFTQNGDMPVATYIYFNDIYSDSNTILKNLNITKEIIRKSQVDFYRILNGSTSILSNYYGDTFMRELMQKYSVSHLKGKTSVIIGTIKPWLEAIALDCQSSKVTTLEYTRKEYEQNDILNWLHINDYLKQLINESKIEEFENAASFSSIEHSGLGRYGDPLDPNGDIKAVKQVHCMIKPGGLFFLGLPASKDNSSYIVFNAHRVYGYKRLAKLFEGWDLLEETKRAKFHSVFVLKKKALNC